ncbi:MAG TPA: DUF3883 domain-containing protein [Terriglobales bacterium]|jgi:hypothetical protein|nr:DUF3883 domain-containing protein [Terriglobales bacterium]
MASILDDLAISTAALSEEELWKRLEEQHVRARRIEELVTELERKRLRDAGRPKLAEAVQRISKRDCGAGYDVMSFELDGAFRYIEVKSSTGKSIRFFWSATERNCAKKNLNYWIYFIPLAQHASATRCSVIRIQNPLAQIASGDLIEESTNWLVMGVENCRSHVVERVKI